MNLSTRARSLTSSINFTTFVLIIASVTIFVGTQPNSLAQAPSSESGLVAVTGADASFDSLLNEYYPGISHFKQYALIRPYLVLLQNNSSQTAKAYAVRWKVTEESGYQRNLDSSYVRRQLTIPIAEQSIRPGSIRLISPLFNISPQEYSANPYFQERYRTDLFPAFTKSTIAAKLDGVIYSDGSFIGENETRILQKYRCGRNAERDEILLILASTENDSNTDIAGLLRSHIITGYSVSDASIRSEYRHARAESADMMFNLLRHLGREKFIERLKVIRSIGNNAQNSHMAAWF